MKTLSALLLLIVLTTLSCHKQNINNHIMTLLSGTYSGKSEFHSNHLEQIFTSPDMSHYEWVNDSTITDPNILIVNCISTDSFELAGPVALLWSDYWRHFAWDELQKSDTAYVLSKYLFSSGYYSESLEVIFATNGKQVTVNYDHAITNSDATVTFDGTE